MLNSRDCTCGQVLRPQKLLLVVRAGRVGQTVRGRRKEEGRGVVIVHGRLLHVSGQQGGHILGVRQAQGQQEQGHCRQELQATGSKG